MHSRIFQISQRPVEMDGWVREDVFIDNAQECVDYVSTLYGEEREENIKSLVDEILPNGMFTLNKGFSLTFNGGMDEWRENYVKHIQDAAMALNADNVFDGLKLYNLTHTIETDGLTYSLFTWNDDNYAENYGNFMRHIDRLKVGDRLYIGGVYDYHF